MPKKKQPLECEPDKFCIGFLALLIFVPAFILIQLEFYGFKKAVDQNISAISIFQENLSENMENSKKEIEERKQDDEVFMGALQRIYSELRAHKKSIHYGRENVLDKSINK